MKNIWLDGGSWTCAWGGGVIQYLKQNYPEIISNYDNVGGYSAGGYLALNVYLDFNEPDFWECFYHNPHSFGKYHLWTEEVLRRTWKKDKNYRLMFDNKISLTLFSIQKRKQIFRNNFSNEEDFIKFTKGSAHIPFMCDFGLYKSDEGYSIDAGAFRRDPPKNWKLDETLIISPWRNSTRNIIGPSKSIPKSLLINPNFDICKEIFDQGIDDAKLWVKKYY